MLGAMFLGLSGLMPRFLALDNSSSMHTDDCLLQADNVLIMFQLPLWHNCPVFPSFVEYLVVTVN